ncbi:hypothetical protein B0H66DRAFT_533830 [Apodospora peruviana]|uniref:Uncharacterized protein n=1 Tax=Apodospora peruviana TaxID=516989 RepID=A0AAE0I676_9PEZI|nr:hypothetical protein B0H66DRAFT_533830 [Apodospora peruviana]
MYILVLRRSTWGRATLEGSSRLSWIVVRSRYLLSANVKCERKKRGRRDEQGDTPSGREKRVVETKAELHSKRPEEYNVSNWPQLCLCLTRPASGGACGLAALRCGEDKMVGLNFVRMAGRIARRKRCAKRPEQSVTNSADRIGSLHRAQATLHTLWRAVSPPANRPPEKFRPACDVRPVNFEPGGRSRYVFGGKPWTTG